MSPTLVIGDVHGCAQELDLLVRRVGPARVVLLGDVFAKGPDPAGCWALVREGGFEGVLGNHDARMLEVWDAAVAGEGRSVHHQAVRALGGDPEVRNWLASLPLVVEGTGWLAVHGGLDPEGGAARTTRRQALAMRRWPMEEGDGPFWWEHWPRLQPQAPLVLYGHDAVRGLQDHRPRTLGLDSGCVYGGRLTGFVVEEGLLVQVPAVRAWCPVGVPAMPPIARASGDDG